MLRRLAVVLAGVLGLVVVLAVAAFAYAQTQFGRNQIAGLLAQQLSKPGQPARVEGLGGILPFDVELAHLSLPDADGVWLEVDDARIVVRPAALLRGEVMVEQMGARRVSVSRLPISEPAPTPPEPFSLPRLPELPSSLPRIAIDRLFVDVIELGEPILGEPATFALDGSAGTGSVGNRADARLTLRRTDQPTAKLELDASVDLPAGTLKIDLQGSETGGLLAAATGRPAAGALRLSLVGEGPLSGWQGKLAVEAERLARLDLAVDLAYAERRSLGLAGALDAAPGALPGQLADVVGTHADLTLRAGETAPRRYAIETLELQTASLGLSGSGGADLAADTLRGNLTANAPDLTRFSALAGTALDGAAELKLAVKGSARQPDVELAVTGTDLRAATVAMSRLTGVFAVAFATPLGDGPVGLLAKGRASTEGLALEGRTLADGRVELTLDGELPARGKALVRELALRSSLGEVTSHASIDRDRLSGTARLDARVPELKAVTLALTQNLPLAGAVDLGADVALGEDTKRIEVALEGKATGLTGLPPGAQELIGAEPTLQAKAVVEPESSAAFRSLMFTGAGVRLEGEPRYAMADRSLGGELRVAIPDLAPIQPVVGQPLAGAAALRAGLAGSVDQPAITLDGTVDRLAVAGQSFDRVALTGDITGPLETPAGAVNVTATRGKQDVALTTGYRLAGDLLTLTGLTLNAPATRLAGNGEVALAGPLVRGELAGEIRDLGTLQAWIGQKLTGSARLDLRLTSPQSAQDATLKVDMAGVGGGFGSLRSAALAVTITDALGRGGIDGSLRAQDLATPSLAVANAVVIVGGRLAAMDVDATVAGNQAGQAFDLSTAAGLELVGPRKTVRVTKLAGKVAGENLRLGQAANLTLDGSTLDVDRVALELGPAKLNGKLQLGATKVAGELTLATLPLATLGRFGAPPLAGTGQAKVALAGTRSAPEATLNASVAKAALDPAAKVKLDGRLDGSLGGGRLIADLSLDGLGKGPLTARASLPATFTLDPPAFTLNDKASLDGRIGGPVDLARAAQLAAMSGLQLAGTLQAALDVSGTIQQPGIAGTLALDGGSVQDVVSGVVFRKLAMRARADDDRLTIEQLTATDPTGGTLQGKGALRLLVGGGLGYDVTIDANKARVLDNTLGVVILSGALGAAGDLAKSQVRGQLSVDRADIQIPDGTGPSIPVIEVKEVNKPGGPTPAKTEAQPAQPFAVALDIGVDIPGRLFVRGRGLDSEWNGKLALKGNLTDPLVEGELDVRRGYFDLLDRRFTIDRGAIDFAGSRPPVPMIDIAATAKTVEVNVTVALQGPALDPKVTLSSEPALPQDEILSRLLFGTSAARITPMQGLRLAAAVQELQGGGMVSGALTKFRRAVGVDTLDVQSTEATDDAGETTQQTSARVGKYVTDKVYLEVEQGVTDGGSKARVQVDLTPNLSVGSTVDDQSQTGVGVQWRYDY